MEQAERKQAERKQAERKQAEREQAELDHVAVEARDIAASVTWYVETLGASVLYQDDTWAFLKLGRGNWRW